MADLDLGKTDAQWLRFFRELAFGLQLDRLFFEMADRLSKSRTQYWAYVSPSAHLKVSHATPISLSGVNEGVNTAEDGTLYVRITDNGGSNYTVDLYKAAGGASGDKVATGSANADAEVTLAAANSSGMSGTYQLPSSVTATSDDTLRVIVCRDFQARLSSVWDEDGTYEDDPYSRQAAKDTLDFLAGRMRGLPGEVRTRFFNRWGLSDGEANQTARGNEFLEAGETELAGFTVQNLRTNGGVSITRRGLWERLKAAMAGETTGSTQTVVKAVPSGAAGVFRTSNGGAGSVASHTPAERCPAGTATFKCVRGVDNNGLGQETFDGFYKLADGEERVAFTGLVVGQPFSHPNGFGPITLQRTLAKTGDGSNNYFTAASNATVSGENNRNTDAGVLYWKLEETSTGVWRVSFYSSSTLDDAFLVARASGLSTGDTFVATEKNASGVQVVWQLGGTEAAANGQLQLQPFKVDNDGQGTPDEFSVAVTVASGAGLIQTMFSKLFGAQLNSATSGSEVLPDALAKPSTFFPFTVEDN